MATTETPRETTAGRDSGAGPPRTGTVSQRPLYKPRPPGIRGYAEPISTIVLFLFLALAGVLPLLDWTQVFPHDTDFGKGNLAFVFAYTVAVMGFNLLVGYSGQLGLAVAGLFALGGYGTAVLFEDGVPFFLSMFIVASVATVIGVIFAFPAARLKGFFLAIATLAFGELIVKIIELDDEVAGWLDTGGGTGKTIELFTLGGGTNTRTVFWMSYGALVATYVVFVILARGRLGRTLKSVRDIEIATGPIGISATRYKLIAFGFSAFTAAVGGALFAQNATFVNPGTFRTRLLVFLLVMLILGGVTRLWGPLIGAFFFVYIREKLQDVEELRILMFGISLMLAVLMLPGGIGSLPTRLRESRYVKGLRSRTQVLSRATSIR